MPEPKSKRAFLLIVDDEPLNRELLRRVLHREYEIEEAEDATEAVAKLETHGDRIQLILCDQLMPGRNGTQLAAEVRTRWPTIRFMLLTGVDDDPQVLKSVDDGHIAEVVGKPWRGRALKELIIKTLEAGPRTD